MFHPFKGQMKDYESKAGKGEKNNLEWTNWRRQSHGLIILLFHLLIFLLSQHS